MICTALAVLVASCGRTDRGQPGGPTSPPTEASQAEVAPVTLPGEDDEAALTPKASELVLWVPGFLAADTDHNAGAVLERALSRFKQNYPALEVSVVPKAETGQAGVLNYLRTAHRAAPDIVPDMVALDSQDLWQAADWGLIYPLDAAEISWLDDLYPFALDAVRYDDRLYGLPYSADVEHLVYYQSQVPTPPATWDELLVLNQRYLFPAGGRDGYSNIWLLLQYVAAGGELTPDGRLTNLEALESVFNFLAQGRQSGIIPVTVLNLASADTVWSIFASGGVGLADVPSRFFLDQQETLSGVGFAFSPTRTGKPTAIGQVWAFAITTADPEQRALALELAEMLYDPSVQGQWSRLAHRLPTRRSALESWDNSNPYYAFLRQALDVAQALPNDRAFADLSRRLQQVQRPVLSGELAPTDAVMELQAVP